MREEKNPGKTGRTRNPCSAIALSKVAWRRERFGGLFFQASLPAARIVYTVLVSS